jgi:hypothetical protein
MHRFGDMEWAARSDGRVTGRERITQFLAAVRFRIRDRFRANPKALGCATPGEVDCLLREVELPSTALVEKATALVTALGPPALTGHVMRTWAWGTVLALRDGLSFDRETFALAALLHDVALARRTGGIVCFAADGAAQAVAMLGTWGATEAVQRAVGDAICLHVRVAVPVAYGVEAHLVNAGAAVDVVGGARWSDIPLEVKRSILTRYPRGELKSFLAQAFRREHRENPASRMGLWVSLGFLQKIAAAPFDEP